jgi:hypothetical protein
MPKANRNDPCPCGSGRKYKSCCLRRDQISEARLLGQPPFEAALFEKLIEFAQLSRFNEDLTAAYHLYWGGTFALEAARELGVEEARRMFEWFVFDYHSSFEHRYLADIYAETEALALPPEGQELLSAWRKAVGGIFRIVRLGGDGRLELYDPLQERSLEVSDAMFARTAQRGELLSGRLFELEGVLRLGMMTMLLPGAVEAEMVSYVMNAYQRYVADHYQATWNQFLRENGHIFSTFLLSPRVTSLRPLLGPGTRYQDLAATRDKLYAFTEKLAAEQARTAKDEAESEKPLPMHRTATGIILPGEAPAESPAPKKGEASKPTILIPGRDF